MKKNLYKVIVQTEIMVVADSEQAAIKTAVSNAAEEIGSYGNGKAYLIQNPGEIPKNWLAQIPYYPEDWPVENMNCVQVFANLPDSLKPEQKQAQSDNKTQDIKPETKNNEANMARVEPISINPNGVPLPKLKFKI